MAVVGDRFEYGKWFDDTKKIHSETRLNETKVMSKIVDAYMESRFCFKLDNENPNVAKYSFKVASIKEGIFDIEVEYKSGKELVFKRKPLPSNQFTNHLPKALIAASAKYKFSYVPNFFEFNSKEEEVKKIRTEVKRLHQYIRKIFAGLKPDSTHLLIERGYRRNMAANVGL